MGKGHGRYGNHIPPLTYAEILQSKEFSVDIFDNSILIVAHPDDEILWFSSILNSVDRIIIIFLKVQENDEWTLGREKSKIEYPLKNIEWLEIDEAGSFNSANWLDPQESAYGIKLNSTKLIKKAYRNNYLKTKCILEPYLNNCKNVFTHNPWGEYGNEEHCQVYKIIRDLQLKFNYNIWFPNFISNKTAKLFSVYSSLISHRFISLKTNIMLASQIKNIYQKNFCWTWYNDWEWFSDDIFISLSNNQPNVKSVGYSFPLKMINVKLPNIKKSKLNRLIFNRFNKQLLKQN